MTRHISKIQIAKMSVLRNLVLSALTLVALMGAAHAQSANQIQQSGTDAMLKAKDEADRNAAKSMIERYENDQKYQETIREQPSAPKSNDPWGNVRAAAPANSAAKPAVKSATKTASGSGKATAGAIKPAATTNGTAQKNQ